MPDFAAIPGLAALQALTLGDPHIKIAVLDGPADLDRACFKGANVSRVKPYWQETLEPIEPIYIQQQLKILALKEQRKALQEVLKEREDQLAESTAQEAEVTSQAVELAPSSPVPSPPNGDQPTPLPDPVETLDPVTLDPVMLNGKQPFASMTLVTPSVSESAVPAPATIFNALLENTESPLLERYHDLSATKLQTPVEPDSPADRDSDSHSGIDSDIDPAAAIEALETEIKALVETIPETVQARMNGVFHATGIFGTLFGQPGSPVEGIAPYCTAINIPLFDTPTAAEALSPLNLAHAFNLARELQVDIIHCAACHPTQTGFAHEMIQKAVQQCQEANILIVAPAGNDQGECFCVPAILPDVLSVGMMKDDGQPANYSNWGGEYQYQGILAPGENIVAAQPGTDEPTRQEGTSLSAPLMTGIAALLLSLQLKQGEQPNPEAVRLALLNSAVPCDPDAVEEPERCLAGKLDLPSAYYLLTGQPLLSIQPAAANPSKPPLPIANRLAANLPIANLLALSPPEPAPLQSATPDLTQTDASSPTPHATPEPATPHHPTLPTITPAAPTSLPPSTISPSAVSNKVYALGTIGYDFGTDARRDTFKQRMSAVDIDGAIAPANPYDARQMVNYLEQTPTAAKALIWTLNLDLNPIYVLEPKHPFAHDIYETLVQMLAGQVEGENSEDYIERVSIPGRLQAKTVELFSGQIIPVVEIENARGMYGWQVNDLVRSALATVRDRVPTASDDAMQRSLDSFLQRIYFELGNLGQMARERAVNFAATNAFQAASTFAEAVALGMQLDNIEVEKSPFCRLDSDCWDVILVFSDPENNRRARKLFRFTIDVKDTIPVTLGEVRSWSVPEPRSRPVRS